MYILPQEPDSLSNSGILGKHREPGVGIGNFSITQKSNWLSIAEQNHDILVSGKERVLEVISSSIIFALRNEPREENLGKTYSKSVYGQNCECNSDIIF